MKTHFVCWAAQRQDGSVAAPVESFENERSAIANFHIRAGQAANGTNLKDTVVLFTAAPQAAAAVTESVPAAVYRSPGPGSGRSGLPGTSWAGKPDYGNAGRLPGIP